MANPPLAISALACRGTGGPPPMARPAFLQGFQPGGGEEEEARAFSTSLHRYPSSITCALCLSLLSKIHSCLLFYIDHHRAPLRDQRPKLFS